MATYKVLQDIEAEDKLFGPLTLKQFIFAAITIVLGFIGFRVMFAGAPIFIKMPIILVLLPFFLIFGFLAAPIGRDQPNDVWLLARLRFLFKPRTRIWNQDGLSELVTITVPKKIETVFTKDYSQDEVKSRLQALANTVDSRGWAVKNVNTNMFAQPGYLSDAGNSDRLIDPGSIPQEVPTLDILASDDMLDPANNARAQQLDQMIQKSANQHKQEIINQMSGDQRPQSQAPAQPPQDYWFLNQPQPSQMPLPQDYATFQSQSVVAPGGSDTIKTTDATKEEEDLVHKITQRNQQATERMSDHMKVLQPLHDKDGKIVVKPLTIPVMPAQDQSTAQVTQQTAQYTTEDTRQDPVNPAILGLAQNDDLNIATIARQAEQINKPKDDGEVVISLH